MHKSNGICKICQKETETTIHLLFECNIASQLWQIVEEMIQNIINYEMHFSIKTTIFGITKEENFALKQIINFIIMETKWQIWKHRNEVKYGQKQVELINTLFNRVVRNLKQGGAHAINLLKKKRSTPEIIEAINMFEKLINQAKIR